MFKLFFSIDGNERFMEDLLEPFFGKSVEIKEIMSELNVQNGNVQGKTGRLDLVVILKDETVINLEMQLRNTDDIISRMMLYNSRLVSQQLKTGSAYENLRPTISIVFLDYEVPEFAGLENPIHKTIEVFEEDRNRISNKGLQEKYYIELPKFRKTKVDMNVKINQWLAFIDSKERRLVEMAILKNTVIREAQNEIERLMDTGYSRFLDAKFKEEYERACYEHDKARYEKEKASYEEEKDRFEEAKGSFEKEKGSFEKEKGSFEKEKASFEREKAKLKQEATKSQKEISKLEKEVDKSHKLGIEEGYLKAERKIYSQMVKTLFSNGFSKKDIIKNTQLSENEVDEILQDLTA